MLTLMKNDVKSDESLNNDKDNDPKQQVEIRVPPFYPDKPALWFAMMEAQFSLANIKTDELRYYYIISYLEPDYAYMVDDIICSPPTEQKYDKIKSELIKRITKAEEKKLKKRLMKEEMGDKQPSEFYQHLQELAGPEVPEDFLVDIWISGLPSELQKFMKTVIKPNKRRYTDLADMFYKDHCPRPVSPCSDPPPHSLNDLSEQLEELASQVEVLNSKMDKMTKLQERS